MGAAPIGSRGGLSRSPTGGPPWSIPGTWASPPGTMPLGGGAGGARLMSEGGGNSEGCVSPYGRFELDGVALAGTTGPGTGRGGGMEPCGALP
jgi:hypothetical protein